MADVIVADGVETIPTVVENDNIYFTGGSQTVSGNIDFSGINAIGIVEVSGAFKGQIGSSVSPMKAEAEVRFIYAASQGDCYFQSSTFEAVNTAMVQILGGGHFHLSGGTVTRFEMRSGIASIGTSAITPTVRVSGGTCHIFDDTSTRPTELTTMGQGAPTVYMYRGVNGTLSHGSGTMIVESGTSNNFTTITVWNSNFKVRSIGDITTMNLYGAIPDLSELKQPITSTGTLNINMALPGATQFLNNPLVSFNTVNKLITDGR